MSFQKNYINQEILITEWQQAVSQLQDKIENKILHTYSTDRCI